MFYIKNTKTGKRVKSAITCKPLAFGTPKDAADFARGLERDSKLDATAFNRIRPTKYMVIS